MRVPSPFEPSPFDSPGDATQLGRPESAEHVHERGMEPGAVVGRHVVLQKIGAGGMGVVYAAYDPELDRKVALKLLLPGAGGTTGRLRLLREAQAMARLSHPNVVGIHDVGTAGEHVWIAMEFVQGQTLGAWLRAPRGWREVLEVMRAAGAGLAAAHAAGLLHRDFKPDNVMIGDDGRVCVMDFGLARLHADPRSRESEDSSSSRSEPKRALATDVTRVGVIVGTPSHMAPEQFKNEGLTAAADQFAFCVTLWRALHGERPFDGLTPAELAGNVLAGKLRPPVASRGVPSWLQRACERGLAVEPGQRWPSMHALLDTLAQGHARARRRKGLVGLGLLALSSAAAVAAWRWEVAQRTAACEESGAEVEMAWNPARAQALREALVGTDLGYASTTADKTIPWLERHAEAWREARVEVCLDARVRARWDADTLDRALWCLDERRTELGSLVDELTRADATVLSKAVTAASGLASAASCRDERVLRALAPPQEDDREAVRSARADLVRANNLERAGRYAAGLELARSAFERAQALPWRPLAAAAGLRKGALLARIGAYVEAETVLEDAYFEAADGIAPEVAFEAARKLVFVVGVSAARRDDGRRWGRLAQVALRSIPDDERLREAGLLGYLSMIQEESGARDEAEELEERALAIFERALGPSHPDVAAALTHLGSLYKVAGDYDQAIVLHERALAIFEAAVGPEHPHVASCLNNLANIHHVTGDHEHAKVLYEQALAINESARGPASPEVANNLHNLANTHVSTGAYATAEALYERALAIHEGALGPTHTNLADPLMGLANVALTQHRPTDAVARAERALLILEEGDGAAHRLAKIRFTLGKALWQAAVEGGGDRVRAMLLAEQARDAYQTIDHASEELAEVEAWLATHRGEP